MGSARNEVENIGSALHSYLTPYTNVDYETFLYENGLDEWSPSSWLRFDEHIEKLYKDFKAGKNVYPLMHQSEHKKKPYKKYYKRW